MKLLAALLNWLRIKFNDRGLAPNGIDRLVDEPEDMESEAVLDLNLQIARFAQGEAVGVDGQVSGHEFYYRADHHGWSFTVSINAGDPQHLLSPTPGQGFFDERGREGYVLYGSHDETDSGYLTRPVVERHIRACAAQFLADRKSGD